jgi:hypothetical protein
LITRGDTTTTEADFADKTGRLHTRLAAVENAN